jgi:hypothetical protein
MKIGRQLGDLVSQNTRGGRGRTGADRLELTDRCGADGPADGDGYSKRADLR